MEEPALIETALAAGFTAAGFMEPGGLEFRAEVREMCRENRCGRYGTCWTCPPFCGGLEDCARRAGAYGRGLLVQTWGPLEDPFDYEAMQSMEERHKASFYRLAEGLREEYPRLLPMGAGACTLCPACACPGGPCRHPDQAAPSMESFGLVVSDVCRLAGLPYYYGPSTMCYVSLYLLE